MKKEVRYINLRKIVHRVYCDYCDIELKDTGIVLTSYPPQYPYRCPQCGREYCFNESYPWAEIVGDEVNEMGYATSL